MDSIANATKGKERKAISKQSFAAFYFLGQWNKMHLSFIVIHEISLLVQDIKKPQKLTCKNAEVH